MYTEFELLKVKVPIIFLDTEGSRDVETDVT
jgi:hypothetical protein